MNQNKIVFAHVPKSAGSTINIWFRLNLPKYVKLIDSWLPERKAYITAQKIGNLDPKIGLNRDWTIPELNSFLKVPYAYVHNHVTHWPKDIVQKYKENGWYFFSFLRDNPYDMLCSFYFFFKNRKDLQFRKNVVKERSDTLILSLDDWLDKWSNNPHLVNILPNNIYEHFDYFNFFSDNNFKEFIRQELGLNPPFEFKVRNKSPNEGWHFYRINGEISDKTAAKVERGEFVAAYEKLAQHIKEKECAKKQSLKIRQKSRGILTAATSEYMPILEIFVKSCNEQNIPVAVYNDGLENRDKKFLEDNNVIVLDPLNPIQNKFFHQFKKCGSIPIKAYEKPFKCQNTIFNQTIWVDADAIPLRNMHELFNILDKKDNFFTKAFFSPHASCNSELIKRMGYRKKTICTLNSGVFGWNKNKSEIIDLWAAATLFVLTNPDLNKLPNTADQDILCYCVNTIDSDLILNDINFNTPANYLTNKDKMKRKNYLCTTGIDEILQHIRDDHPESYVVHWMGPHKMLKLETLEISSKPPKLF
jgi:hypothetical protein